MTHDELELAKLHHGQRPQGNSERLRGVRAILGQVRRAGRPLTAGDERRLLALIEHLVDERTIVKVEWDDPPRGAA